MSPFLAGSLTLVVNEKVALLPLSAIEIVSKSVFALIDADNVFQKSVLFWFVVNATAIFPPVADELLSNSKTDPLKSYSISILNCDRRYLCWLLLQYLIYYYNLYQSQQ